jgi:hypothetical protein
MMGMQRGYRSSTSLRIAGWMEFALVDSESPGKKRLLDKLDTGAAEDDSSGTDADSPVGAASGCGML